jgi:PAS domain S-box-containing protein
MKEGFYSLDKDFRVLHWNTQMEVIAGVPKEVVLGHVILDLFPEVLKCFYTPLFHQVIEQREPIHKEFICPTNDKWIDLSIYPTDNGLSIFCKDIHDRKVAEQELQKLSLIAKETENAVVIITPDRKTTWVNAAFTRMTGYAFEEIVGKTPGELLEGPGTDENTIRYIMEAYQKEQPFQVEILNYKKTGEPFWSEMHIQPLFDSEGNVEQFFSIRKDITERKKLEQELEEERKKITAAVIAAQEKERAVVSQELHDNVNQVLTTVKLYTELCRDGIGDVKAIMDKSLNLLQVSINEIRSLSKRLSAPSIGNIKFKDSIKDLIDVVSATNKLCIVLEATGIEHLKVDQEMHLALYRILQEHLTNILKHAKADYVQIIIEQRDNNQLVLQVTDNGIGFDPKQKRNGIGITNMLSRVESIKGTLAINSTPGMGCELVVQCELKR